jgi:hypothetical protein
MRQYAHDRLAEADELETLRNRHLAWCVDIAAKAELELTSSHQVPSLHMLEGEHENLRAAFDWAYASKAGRSLWSLAGNLAHFWVLHGHFAEASQTIERAAAVGDEVPMDEQLAGRWASAYTTFFSGRFERAAHEARDVLDQARRCHDDRILARALCTLGAVEMFFDLAAARAHLQEAVALATARREDYWRGEALTLIVQTYMFQDDYPRAQAAIAAARAPQVFGRQTNNTLALVQSHMFLHPDPARGAVLVVQGLWPALDLQDSANMRVKIVRQAVQ